MVIHCFGKHILLSMIISHLASSEDILLSAGGQLKYHSLCSSRKFRFNNEQLIHVSAMSQVNNQSLVVLTANRRNQGYVYTLQLADSAKPKLMATPKLGLLEDVVVSSKDTVIVTDATNRSIISMSLSQTSQRPLQVVPLRAEDRPRGLAMDGDSGLLFWTNWRYSEQAVQRLRLDGLEPRRLVAADLYLPGGVAVDGDWLYFSDVSADSVMRVERVRAQDGSQRHALYLGGWPQPTAGPPLQLSAGMLYWSDAEGVWRLPVPDDSMQQLQSPTLVLPLDGRPDAFLVTAGHEQCLNYVTTAAEVLKHSPAAVPCPVRLCLNGGQCRRRLDGTAANSCSCQGGFSGLRCQLDACWQRCLNGGTCVRPATHGSRLVACHCQPGTDGTRCERTAANSISTASAAPMSDTTGNASATANVSDTPGDATADDDVSSTLAPLPAVSVWQLPWGLSPAGLRQLLIGLLTSVCLLVCVLALICVLYVVHQRRRRRGQLRLNNTPPLSPRPRRFVGVVIKPSAQRGGGATSARPDIEDCCQLTLCDRPCGVRIKSRGSGPNPSKHDKESLIPATDATYPHVVGTDTC